MKAKIVEEVKRELVESIRSKKKDLMDEQGEQVQFNAGYNLALIEMIANLETN